MNLQKRHLSSDFTNGLVLLRSRLQRKLQRFFIRSLALRRGYSVSRLLSMLPEESRPPKGLIDKAKELDQHYIMARYPNLHPEGSLTDYYTEEQARRSISYAREIIEWIGKVVQA